MWLRLELIGGGRILRSPLCSAAREKSAVCLTKIYILAFFVYELLLLLQSLFAYELLQNCVKQFVHIEETGAAAVELNLNW